MKYMLDTNICSYIIKNKPKHIFKKFNSLGVGECAISSITLSELRYWTSKNKLLHERSGNSGLPNIHRRTIDNFISHLPILEFDSAAAEIYGDIRANLETLGQIIGGEDLFIGAHALSQNMVLVTNNIKEFKRIPKLRLENWVLETV